jgi:protein-S-isoprenylcysteine O-methyltransferase Ste14
MLGFLIQWPTVLTVLMFPVLVVMYWRLALREEQEAENAFGDAYRRYAKRVPRFIPRKKSSPIQTDFPDQIPGEQLNRP